MEDFAADDRWIANREATAARLGVHGDFVHVPQLARALGLSSTTIYAQMRRGNFPMPHRKVGNVCMVKLDDYVRWFEAAEASIRAPASLAPLAIPAEPAILAERAEPPIAKSARKKSDRLPSGETRAALKARVQREVLDNMRRKGFDV